MYPRAFRAADFFQHWRTSGGVRSLVLLDCIDMVWLVIMPLHLDLKCTVVSHIQGENIKTEIGIAQGDCLSAVLFIFYLARSMDTKKATTHPSKKNIYFEINPQYADDITWASTAEHRIDHIKTPFLVSLKKETYE